jgi:stage V sporulation protein B
MLCSGGIPRAISLVTTEAKVKNGEYEAHNVCLYSLKLFCALGAILTVLLIIFAGPISALIGNFGAWLSIITIAPSLFFVAASGVIRGYLNGTGQIIHIAVYQVVEGGVKFVFGLLFAYLAFRLEYSIPIISALTVLGITIGSLIGCIYLYICQKNSKPHNKTGQKSDIAIDKKEILKRIFYIAAPLTLSGAVMGITNIIDLFLIMQRLLSLGYNEQSASALYGNYTTLAVPFLNLVISLVGPLAVAALPVITEQHVKGCGAELQKRFEMIFHLCAFIAIPCAVAFMIFPVEILTLLFKDESALVGAPLLCLMAPSVVFLSLLTMLNTALEATSHARVPLISMSVGAVAKLILGYVLIGREEIGILGAPIGTAVCYGIAFIISVFFALKYGEIKFCALVSLYKPLLISVISIGIAKYIYIRLCAFTFSSLTFILCAVIAVLLYVLFSLFLEENSIKEIKSMSKHTKNA